MISHSKHNEHIPNNFYRVSTKALILDETRTKFLITRETNDTWELPGGGWEYGLSARENVSKEIQEEMGIIPVSVSKDPSYLFSCTHDRTGSWIINLMYETVLPHIVFIPSRECQEVRFVDKDSLPDKVQTNVALFADLFDPAKHKIQNMGVGKRCCIFFKKYYDAGILRLNKKSMAIMEKEEFFEEMREYVTDILTGFRGVETPELLNELFEEAEGNPDDAHDEMIHEVIERLGGEEYDPSVEEDDYEEESDEGDY